MSFLDILGGVVGGVGSLYGALTAENERRQAQAAQQAALANYGRASDTAYQQALSSGGQGLMAASGQGADALRALGSSMGANLAAGGVYNPSAVGGALALGQREIGSNLTDLASRNYQAAAQMHAQQQQNLANMQLGVAGQNVGQSYNDISTATGGLQSFLGALSQANLARSGANAYRATLPVQQGTVNQAQNLPGNALRYGVGNLGSYGTGSTAQAAMQTFQPASPTLQHITSPYLPVIQQSEGGGALGFQRPYQLPLGTGTFTGRSPAELEAERQRAQWFGGGSSYATPNYGRG
jgi:hypothetical protein